MTDINYPAINFETEPTKNNSILKAIADRYSCRGFSDEPVSLEDLKIIAKAGVQAPSSRGNAPWYLAVVTNRQLITQIRDSAYATLFRRDREGHAKIEARGGDLFYNAQAAIIIAAKPTHDLTPEAFDAGLLAENICLAAGSLGLGSLLCGFSTYAFHRWNDADAASYIEALKIPNGYEMLVTVLLGHPKKIGIQHSTDTSTIRFIE